uniref:non-specific serine/threonine protein kinase n=1 Tax=Diabrotica virgifera virgifera TaxID=50390 RepID=A0A6P7H512_DIAVI
VLDVNYDEKDERSYYQQIFTSPTKIGAGFFGEVYKARNKHNNTIYAVKVFKKSIPTMFIHREVMNNEKVGVHPNCVRYFMAWTQFGEGYLCLEACQTSLTAFMKKYSVPQNTLWDILMDITKALKYLHGKNLVHLDVKADNILVSGTHFKLGDFGTLFDRTTEKGKQQNEGIMERVTSDGAAETSYE